MSEPVAGGGQGGQPPVFAAGAILILAVVAIVAFAAFTVLSASVVPVTAADHRPVTADLLLSNRR